MAGLAPGESSLPGLWMAVFSLCPHMVFRGVCVCVSGSVCVCLCERETETEKGLVNDILSFHINIISGLISKSPPDLPWHL